MMGGFVILLEFFKQFLETGFLSSDSGRPKWFTLPIRVEAHRSEIYLRKSREQVHEFILEIIIRRNDIQVIVPNDNISETIHAGG